MRKVNLISFLLLFVTFFGASEVAAQNSRGVGIGVEKTLGGLSGISLVIDMGQFRVDVLFHFDYRDKDPCYDHQHDEDYISFGFAGRFFYLLHSMRQADFSIGGGIGTLVVENDPCPYDYVVMQLEIAAQLRAFLTPSFAINGSFGFAIVFGEDINTGFQIGEGWNGGLLGSFGATYFF
jgi:hypothetical protein